MGWDALGHLYLRQLQSGATVAAKERTPQLDEVAVAMGVTRTGIEGSSFQSLTCPHSSVPAPGSISSELLKGAPEGPTVPDLSAGARRVTDVVAGYLDAVGRIAAALTARRETELAQELIVQASRVLATL